MERVAALGVGVGPALLRLAVLVRVAGHLRLLNVGLTPPCVLKTLLSVELATLALYWLLAALERDDA